MWVRFNMIMKGTSVWSVSVISANSTVSAVSAVPPFLRFSLPQLKHCTSVPFHELNTIQ